MVVHATQSEIGDIERWRRLFRDEAIRGLHFLAADPAPLRKQRHEIVRRTRRLDHASVRISAGGHKHGDLIVLLELVVVRQIFRSGSPLLERKAMVGEVDHRKTLAALLQLLVQRGQKTVRLGNAVEIAGDLLVIHKGLIAMLCTFTGFRMRADQVIDDQLGRVGLTTQCLIVDILLGLKAEDSYRG